MKINVRHEAATPAGEPEGSEATPERACVWVVGDGGETVSTEYLDSGQQVSIEIDAQASVVSSTGEVGPIEAAPPA